MKKLINFLLVFVLMCSLVSCSHFQSTKEPTIDEPTTSQKETTSVKEENISFSEDWRDFKVKVNDVVITLPITYKDFCEKTGCYEKIYEETIKTKSSLLPGDSYEIKMCPNKDNDAIITVWLYNHTQKNANKEDCVVFGITDSGADYENGPSNVVFTKNITVGSKVDNDILKYLGNPVEIIESFAPFYLGEVRNEVVSETMEYSCFYGTIVDGKMASCSIVLSPTDEAFVLPE